MPFLYSRGFLVGFTRIPLPHRHRGRATLGFLDSASCTANMYSSATAPRRGERASADAASSSPTANALWIAGVSGTCSR